MSEFSEIALKWYDQHGRKHLPWQQDINPYRVWLSEIMLQQTQVATVIGYFERFTAKFPDVQSLAAADIDEVLHLWTGLGYYARARNLHACAVAVVNDFDGKFPDNVDQLCELKGIGRSTAAAIVSIAFEKKASILDGNVKRVLSRYRMVEGWTQGGPTLKKLWVIAEELQSEVRFREYTQVLMDLGATLCTRSKPKCDECPLSHDCYAFQESRVSEFPNPKPKKDKPVKQTWMLVLQDQDGRLLMEKRPNSGIWGGLYSFIEFASLDLLETHLALKGLKNQKVMEGFRHTFSHYHLDITPVFVKNKQQAVAEKTEQLWYHPLANEQVGVNAAVVKILDRLNVNA